MTRADRKWLAELVARCLATDEALARLGGEEPAPEALMDADRRARDALLDALAELGRRPDGTVEEAAIVLPDGTIAVRAQAVDGLALVRPGFITRTE